MIISGGISGAITDVYSKQAVAHAELYYNEIRSFTTDVNNIVNNTNGEFSYDDICRIKNYLFYDFHELDGDVRRFDPDFAIAQSWSRLAFDMKNIQEHDLILLRHEIEEMKLVDLGMNQDDAHIIVSSKYNYQIASTKYYESLKKK